MKSYHRLTLSICALTSTLLAGCAYPPNNQQVGTVTGAVVGGVIGSQFGSGVGNVAATVGGAAIGGMIGSSIGANMDEADRIRAEQAMAYERETMWESRSGRYYVQPRGVFMTRDGRMCRNFVMRDRTGTALNGVACCDRVRPNGNCVRWRIN